MKLKLKEDPREWRKNLLVWILIAEAILTGLLFRGRITALEYRVAQGGGMLLLFLALFCPRLFRGFYRGSMTVNHYVGRVIGRITLTIFYFVIITPLGIVLRLTGRDLLQLRRRPGTESYWRKCPPPTPFDRMF